MVNLSYFIIQSLAEIYVPNFVTAFLEVYTSSGHGPFPPRFKFEIHKVLRLICQALGSYLLPGSIFFSRANPAEYLPALPRSR